MRFTSDTVPIAHLSDGDGSTMWITQRGSLFFLMVEEENGLAAAIELPERLVPAFVMLMEGATE